VEELDGPISKEQLGLSNSIKSKVQEYLDERRLLAMRVEIAPPQYQPVAVEARVRVRPGADFAQITTAVKRTLFHYLNPVYGGPRGQGWPFGRGLFSSEISSVVQSTAGVDYVEDVRLFTVDWETGQKQPVLDRINLQSDGLLCSSDHQVTVLEVEGYE
jgi:hypothetical protein